jgi:GT2 family glycosyltransferase
VSTSPTAPSPHRPSSSRRVRLVVLNYNGGELTLRCLEHLRRLDWPAEALEVVVVDNASTDGSPEEIERRFPWVELRRNDHNGGFPANNLALRDLDGLDHVGLINNDAFVDPGWLHPLVDTLDADPSLGAVAGKLVLEPRFLEVRLDAPTFVPGPEDPRTLGVMVREVRVLGEDVSRTAHLGAGGWGREHDRAGAFEWTAAAAVLRVPVPADGPLPPTAEVVLQAEAPKEVAIDGGGGPVTVAVGPDPTTVAVPLGGTPVDVLNNVGSVVFPDGSGADRGWLERDDGQYDEPADVFAWCGGGVLFRPEYLHDTGLFDEDFFLYYEDTDLSWRGRERGWRYRTAPAAVARHVHAATSGEGSAVFAHHVERNRLVMLVKNAPLRMALTQVARYVLVTASYARRDVVAPLRRRQRPRPTVVVRRVGSFLGFLRLLPVMAVRRREIARRQVVPDAVLVAELTPRPEPRSAAAT